MNVYNFISWFFMYSFLGYPLKYIVLSTEYKRPIVDRGFSRGLFYVIYGFDALGVCMLLRPVSGGPMELYMVSMAMTTTMELITINTMVRPLDSPWWDYSRKPFNYKGMIYPKNSLGWGFLGLFFFCLLDIRVRAVVFSLPGHIGSILAVGLIMLYLVDFTRCFRLHLDGMEDEDALAVGWLKIY